MGKKALRVGLIVAALIGVGARFVRLDSVPPGFYSDEASAAYNAYCMVETGKDEHGRTLPLYFEAFGDYKNPVFIYATVPGVAVVGPVPGVCRLVAALFGFGTCLLVGLAVWQMTRDRWWSLAGTAVTLFLPWMMIPARVAHEAITLPFFLLLGWVLWMRAHEIGGRTFFILSGVAHGIAFYTYSTGRLAAAIHLVLLVVVTGKARRAGVLLSGLAFVLMMLPALGWSIGHEGSLALRFQEVSIFSHSDYPMGWAVRFVGNVIRYVSPAFLFTDGDPNLRHHVGAGGVLFLFLLPGLVMGCVRAGSGYRSILWICILFPLVPSLTHKSFHLLRSIHAAPFMAILAVMGTRWIFAQQRWRLLVGLILAFAVLEVPHHLYTLFRKYPDRAGAHFQVGVGEAVRIALATRQGALHYDPGVFEDEGGRANQPGIHFLFSGRLDPAGYRTGGLQGFQIYRWEGGADPPPGSWVLCREGMGRPSWTRHSTVPLSRGQAGIFQVPPE